MPAVVQVRTGFSVSVLEVPLQFRSNAASFIIAATCGPPLGLDPRGGDGPLVGRATDPLVVALGECAATALLGVGDVVFWPTCSDFGYAAAAKEGSDLRRVGDRRFAGVVRAVLAGKWPLDASTDVHPGCIGLAVAVVKLERRWLVALDAPLAYIGYRSALIGVGGAWRVEGEIQFSRRGDGTVATGGVGGGRE